LLLKNLKDVRRRLLDLKLEQSFCHDLLARVIFTQYLFHGRDSEGNAYFSRVQSPSSAKRLAFECRCGQMAC
jgi:hypothetical protein